MRKLTIYILMLSFIIFLSGCSKSLTEKNNAEPIKKTIKIENNKDSNNLKIKEKVKLDKNNSEVTKKEELVSNTKKDDIKKNITIVIDPGHSSISSNQKEPISPDSKELKLKDTLGATGINSKRPEYEITLSVALELSNILKTEGYNVILTKDKVTTKLSNIERTKVGNDHNANLMIRLHCDGVDSPKAQGASILVPKVKGYVTKNIAKKSKVYGEKIINNYSENIGFKNRGIIYREDLTGFNWSKVPIVLLEMGFISNPKEDAYLSNPNNYKHIASSIAKGINSCFT